METARVVGGVGAMRTWIKHPMAIFAEGAERGLIVEETLFKLDEPRFWGAHDPLAALILCGAHRADRVVIARHGGSSTGSRSGSISIV